MDSRRASKGGISQLSQNVSDMSLTSGDGDWEKVANKNKGNGARQRAAQSSAPKAWGQPDTTQRLGIQGSSGSGQAPGNLRKAAPCYGPRGRGGNPLQKNVAPPLQHGWNWAARVGSTQAVAAPLDEKEEDDVPDIATSEEDDAFYDDEDDDLLDDRFDSDENPSSHESQKSHSMLSEFFESLGKLTVEEINGTERQWHCPACQGGPGAIDWYRGLQPLLAHARTKGSKRVKLHRFFGKVLEEELRRMGTSAVPVGESFGNWEGLRSETKDHQIIWPPIVLVMNTRLEKGDDEKWLGMGNQELLDYFSSYAVMKAQHSYGPQGHRGIGVLIFESSAVGYMEAERLHNQLSDQGTGRQAWEQRRWMFNHGGKRQLFGFLATKEDLDVFNQHCKGKQRLKYEMRSYNEMVVSQMKQMSEDNQQLTWYKEKAAKENRRSKALGESLNVVSERLRKTSDENRIVKQRSKIHHEQNQEEMDFQDTFFRQQMQQIEESIDAKENNFEKAQWDERKKVEELSLLALSTEERSRRMEEVERFIKSQDKEMSHFVLARDELEKLHEKEMEVLRKRYQDETVKLKKEFDIKLSQLMDKYTPSSTTTTTQGDS